MDATPTLVGPPVHAPWPGGKLPERVVRAAGQPPADFLRPPKPALMGHLQLALIAQPVAVATGEHAPDDVQPDNPPAAVPRTGTTAACRRTCKASRRWQLTARGPRSSPLWRRAGSRARAAEGSPSGASPVRRRTCNPQRSICLRLHGAPSIAPFFSSPNNRNRLANPTPPLGAIDFLMHAVGGDEDWPPTAIRRLGGRLPHQSAPVAASRAGSVWPARVAASGRRSSRGAW